MTYGAETWTLTTKTEKKLSATQQGMKLLNINYRYRKINKWVMDQTKVMDIMEIIKNRTWTLAGHIITDGV